MITRKNCNAIYLSILSFNVLIISSLLWLFSEYNIIPVEAIKHIEGYKGCFLSHKKCIQIAKEKNLKYIIVLEDDCLPLENFSKRFENIISFLDSYDNWDLLHRPKRKMRQKNVKLFHPVM